MRSKFFTIACVFSLFAFIGTASAEETYYTNDNGVSFTEEEYEFLTAMYWDGYQDLMTEEDYEKFVESDIISGDFATDEYTEEIYSPMATVIGTTNKTLKISRSCSSSCSVSVTLTWNVIPSITGYDVMGAYLDGVTRQGNPTTLIVASTGTTYSTQNVLYSNGFGTSLMLPSGATSIIVNQSFDTTTGGKIYASYQHATSSISLANSKNYIMSKSGFGGVFNFGTPAYNIYDRMNGVSVSV